MDVWQGFQGENVDSGMVVWKNEHADYLHIQKYSEASFEEAFRSSGPKTEWMAVTADTPFLSRSTADTTMQSIGLEGSFVRLALSPLLPPPQHPSTPLLALL